MATARGTRPCPKSVPRPWWTIWSRPACPRAGLPQPATAVPSRSPPTTPTTARRAIAASNSSLRSSHDLSGDISLELAPPRAAIGFCHGLDRGGSSRSRRVEALGVRARRFGRRPPGGGAGARDSGPAGLLAGPRPDDLRALSDRLRHRIVVA